MAKILLVDDDRDFIEIHRIILEKEAYQIISAFNPIDGLELLKREKPGLMILDVMMDEPDDGFALAQKIRREKIDVPILMLTSVGKVLGMDFGKDDQMVPVNEFFEKPLSAEKLVAAVKKHLAK